MKEVYAIQSNITYASTTAFVVGQLPPGAFIVRIYVAVATAFNGGNVDYVDVGTSGTPAAFANDIDVSSTGIASGTVIDASIQSTANPTDVYATYISTATVATAGSGQIVVEYVFDE
jgi:hypothetical protein